MNKIVELYNNAIDKKESNNFKDDVLKLIENSSICDVERKVSKKDNNKKDSGAERKVSKKDNSKNVNKDKDKDNLIDKLLNDKDKDKLHNFSEKVLNNLTNIAKLKEKILINKKEAGELSLPIKNIRLKLDNYKKINILYDDLINGVWLMIFGKNRVNNEMDNIDCNIGEDAKSYLTKYIKNVSDKQVLIYSVSESIDELMEALDENSSNDFAAKEIKDFKTAVIESIDKFLSYIKLETKKKGTEKKDTEKEHIEKVNDKNSVDEDTNNKATTNDNIKAHIKDKQKLIKQRFKSLLKTKKTIKNNIELIFSVLKRLPRESQPKLIELIRLDTISNDSIDVVCREIYERQRKPVKKIDVNKVKSVDAFIDQLINVINNKTVLLKTTVITKLNCIISDLKVKSGMDNIYNFNDIDKLTKVNNDLDKYMKHLKMDIGNVKTILKTISTNQNDSHQILMNLLNQNNTPIDNNMR